RSSTADDRRRDRHERRDDGWVELTPGVAAQLFDRHAERQRLPIAAVGRHRVEGVAAHDDPRGPRNLLPGEMIRVAGSVPALVTRADDRPDVTEQPTDAREQPLT